eukprot:m.21814 g.21814  ORF g.21814 m.21814 type:complete len:470 (+) comp3929_c0_seq1:218-1627(+)
MFMAAVQSRRCCRIEVHLGQTRQETARNDHGGLLPKVNSRLQLVLVQPHLLSNLGPATKQMNPNGNDSSRVECNHGLIGNHVQDHSVEISAIARGDSRMNVVVWMETKVQDVNHEEDGCNSTCEGELGLSQRVHVQRILLRWLEFVETEGKQRRRPHVRQKRQQQVVLNPFDDIPHGRGVEKGSVLIKRLFALKETQVAQQMDHQEGNEKHGTATHSKPSLGANDRVQQIHNHGLDNLGQDGRRSISTSTCGGGGTTLGSVCTFHAFKLVGPGLRHGWNVRLRLQHVLGHHGDVGRQVVGNHHLRVNVCEGRGPHELHGQVELAAQNVNHTRHPFGAKGRHGVERRAAHTHSLGAKSNGLEDIGTTSHTAINKDFEFGRVVFDFLEGSHHFREDFDSGTGKVKLASSVIGQQDAGASLFVRTDGVFGGTNSLENNLHVCNRLEEGQIVPRQRRVNERGECLGRALVLTS